MQKLLFAKIKERISSQTLLVSEIAAVLDCSYDAAYRRLRGDAKLSFEEASLLAIRYGFSIDEIVMESNANQSLVGQTGDLISEEGLNDFIQSNVELIDFYARQQDSWIYYTAKDIPIFDSMTNPLIAKFKYFVWLKLLDPRFNEKNITFDKYQSPSKAPLFAKSLKNLFKRSNLIEFWSDTTITGLVRQVDYYHQAGALNKDDVLLLCKEIHNLVDDVRAKVYHSLKDPSPNAYKYDIYLNELLLMNHGILFTSSEVNALFVPFTFLNYYITQDPPICEMTHSYFQKQMQSCKQISTSDNKDKMIFFGGLHREIERLEKKIERE